MAGRVAIIHQHAKRRRAIEGFHKRILAYSVEDRADAPGDNTFRGLHEIHLAIKDRVIAAVVFGHTGFLSVADRTNDCGAQVFRPLNQQKPNSAGRRVDQNRVAGLGSKNPVNDARCCEPLSNSAAA